ncbi:hypothetical protein [Sediminicurvatus halobius]|uniref:Uncharacterized protein n=1 Tax=Sediminicurvatus halobius TaxID=2182432 RepID=A0A2U2N9C1_9GAMM|nr:hypothetical protein [Spiribacter halobius]PWG65786.1 hypothetical protein DEM34_00535 [Spiribacter halobius]UEX77827.1 hypothetical protein LMH63_18170 [Spiribacter halobius]
MDEKIERLRQALNGRGLASDEVETVCGLVRYIASVDEIPESRLGAGLPLVYQEETDGFGGEPS